MKGVLWLLAATLAAPAFAQGASPDCSAETLSDAELATCTEIAYDVMRAELDETYRLALVRASAWDDRAELTGDAGPVALRDLLERAQSEWTVYAEAECAAEALRSGDAIPLPLQLCYIRLAERRIGDLRMFGDGE